MLNISKALDQLITLGSTQPMMVEWCQHKPISYKFCNHSRTVVDCVNKKKKQLLLPGQSWESYEKNKEKKQQNIVNIKLIGYGLGTVIDSSKFRVAATILE